MKKRVTMLLLAVFIAMCATVNAQLLSTGNNQILKDGNPITLRGVNFGNWLVQEGFMMNLSDENRKMNLSPSTIRRKIKTLLGEDEAKTVAYENSWRDSYITETDFQRAKALGYNVVRVPFHYEMIWNWNTWNTKEEGFKWLDNAATWAKNNGIYLMLCMHCAPGCQNPNFHSDNGDYDNGPVNFWNNSTHVDVAARVWHSIAARYASNPWIAGYDLINEPAYWDNTSLIQAAYETITKQIRNTGDNHIIFAEGNHWGGDLSVLTRKWDNNLVFEGHYYGGQDEFDPNFDLAARKKYANDKKVPFINGEFGENTENWVRKSRIDYETQNVGWLFWSWKRQSTNRAIYSFNSSSWDKIVNYIMWNGAKPSVSETERILEALCNDVRLSSCTYVSSLQNALRPGWPTGSVIWLKNGQGYVNSQNGSWPMSCNSVEARAWEKFTVVDAGDWKIALLGNNGKYVNCQNGASPMTCTSENIYGWESFEWVDVNGQVALKGFNGKFVCSEGGSTNGMMCNRETVSGWESFNYAISTKSMHLAPEESSASEFKIYPNPLVGGVLHTQGINVNATLNVYNTAGILVKTVTVSDIQSIDLSSLSSGMYTLIFQDSDNSQMAKLLVK